MGVVYVAEQEPLAVAWPAGAAGAALLPGQRERFRREVQAVARMQHPHRARVHGGRSGGIPYFAMGWSRDAHCSTCCTRSKGRQPRRCHCDMASVIEGCVAGCGRPALTSGGIFDGSWSECCVHLTRQVAEALEHAHGRGVVHRDVKPSNIAVTPSGRAMLLDFGLASSGGVGDLTDSGSQPGSLPYMSPEQLRGERALDGRTDVYSLGVTLYELLELRRPFTGSTDGLRRAILAGDAPRLREHNRRWMDLKSCARRRWKSTARGATRRPATSR